MKTWMWVALGIGAGLLAICCSGTLVGILMVGGKTAPHDAINLAIVERTTYAESWGKTTAWEITNRSEAPITIKSFRYNGRKEATLAEPTAFEFGSDNKLPINLAIGEKLYFMGYNKAFPGAGFNDAVIYIDIETDKGSLRHSP